MEISNPPFTPTPKKRKRKKKRLHENCLNDPQPRLQDRVPSTENKRRAQLKAAPSQRFKINRTKSQSQSPILTWLHHWMPPLKEPKHVDSTASMRRFPRLDKFGISIDLKKYFPQSRWPKVFITSSDKKAKIPLNSKSLEQKGASTTKIQKSPKFS